MAPNPHFNKPGNLEYVLACANLLLEHFQVQEGPWFDYRSIFLLNIKEYVKRNIQNQLKKVSATLRDGEEKRATRSQPKWTSLRGCLRFSWTCLQVLLKNKRPQRVYFISGRRSFCLPSSIPSPASQVIHNLLFIILFIYVNILLISFRWMLWKVQSGIAPPFFYVIIAEKDTLKTWRASLCPKSQNTIVPNVQMYPVD